MPSERFYIDAPLEGTLHLEGTELHHLAHVMRVRIGDEVEVVNGRGGLATARVVSVGKKEAELEVVSSHTSPIPSSGLTLAVPILRPSKLELIVEKCTELGAHAFLFYPADLSEKDELSENQFERLLYIAISAMKQCGRLDLPALQKTTLKAILQQEGPHFFGDPEAQKFWKMPASATFITGPEKGFSPKEMALLKEKASPVLLHRNVLRAETAPIAATAIAFFSTM